MLFRKSTVATLARLYVTGLVLTATSAATISNTLPNHVNEVDVIIAGGGTAGSVLAARLAAAAPSLSILVIEQGPNNENLASVSYPALFTANLANDSTTALFYQSQPETQLDGRAVVVPAGGVLGGGSSINFMMYSRAQRSDLDAFNADGWSADELLPYMKKLETWTGPDDKGTHGKNGPIRPSRGTYNSPALEDSFIASAAKQNYREVPDVNNLQSVNALSRAYKYINKDGRREDAATRYLRPLLNSQTTPNLRIVVETEVTRILFDRYKKANGVEIRPNARLQPLASSKVRAIKARKLVVASSGALGTPLLLERSGVGKSDVLRKAGVPVIADNQGIGHEYQDHHLVLYGYKSSLAPNDTLDGLIQGSLDINDLIANNDPRLGWNAQDIAAKVRPTYQEVVALGPGFKKAWDRDYATVPDRPLSLFTAVAGFGGDVSLIGPGQYFSVSIFTPYPYSRGSIHITGPKLGDPYTFKSGFFADPLDVKIHVWAYKKHREIARRMSVYRGEVVGIHPAFPPGSAAAPVTLTAPLPPNTPDIKYTAADDAAIEAWLRKNVGTTWHSLGTCKIGRPKDFGAVDARLNVYGVSRLKVVDLSVAPHNIGGNTNNMALTIGEKAAEIILKDLGY